MRRPILRHVEHLRVGERDDDDVLARPRADVAQRRRRARDSTAGVVLGAGTRRAIAPASPRASVAARVAVAVAVPPAVAVAPRRVAAATHAAATAHASAHRARRPRRAPSRAPARIATRAGV